MEHLFLILLGQAVTITEVCADPLNETSCEFIELHNAEPAPVPTQGFSITDGDALDQLLPWNEQAYGAFPHAGVVTGTDSIPAGGWAVVLELGYLLDPSLSIAPGTVILTTGDYALCNGLAASSDPLTLFGPGGTAGSDVLSTFGTPVETDVWENRDDDGLDTIPFDPGNGLSANLFPPGSPDAEGSWVAASPTPGGPPDSPPDTFAVFIEGVWFSPSQPEPGEDCALFAAFHCWGTVSPDQGLLEIFIDSDGDSLAGPGEPWSSWPAQMLEPGSTDTLSMSFSAPARGWYLASATACGAYLGIPLASGGGVSPVITEVMANPWEQASQEFIEVHYPGPGVFLLGGCSFTDGDAVDIVTPLSGTSLLEGGACGVILDPDYSGGLPIPQGTPLFTPGNSSLGNGLATDDPVVLYDRNGTGVENILGTAGTPALSNDPLQCDDDGLDGIPFNPGQGRSMVRVNPAAPDREYNWAASGEGGSPGWLDDCGAGADVMADTIIAPAWVTPMSPFQLAGVFTSVGAAAASNVELFLFNDLDADSCPDASEVITTAFLDSLAPGESFTLEGSAVLPDHGFFLLRALADCSADTVPANDQTSVTVMCGEGSFPVITEVMCNPSDQSRDEFIELFLPGPGVVDPSIFSLSDGDAVDALHGDFLISGRYALILDPDYFSGAMPHEIPPGTPVVLPGNSAIGDGLSGGDPVSLIFGTTVVSTYGTPDNPDDGIPYGPATDMSIELLSPGLPDAEANWFVNPLGPSPGQPPLGLCQGTDYGMRGLRLSPPAGNEGTAVTLRATVESLGTETGAITVLFRAGGTGIGSSSPPPPAPGDSVCVELQWVSSGSGTPVEALVQCAEDENPGNNGKTVPWDPDPGLAINEIMYSPGTPGPEWVELYNGTGSSVELSSYVFSDPDAAAALPGYLLEPGAYAILCPDAQAFSDAWSGVQCAVLTPSCWPTLNNAGDTLSLGDGTLTDWVPFSADWGGGSNVSLERRSPAERGWLAENWGSCTEGATPGRANSICGQQGGPFLSAWPEVFSPDGDGVDDRIEITLNVPGQGCSAEARVYDVTGRVVAELWNGPVPGVTLVLSWDGAGMPVGRYIVFACARNGNSLLEGALVRVLARRL